MYTRLPFHPRVLITSPPSPPPKSLHRSTSTHIDTDRQTDTQANKITIKKYIDIQTNKMTTKKNILTSWLSRILFEEHLLATIKLLRDLTSIIPSDLITTVTLLSKLSWHDTDLYAIMFQTFLVLVTIGRCRWIISLVGWDLFCTVNVMKLTKHFITDCTEHYCKHLKKQTNLWWNEIRLEVALNNGLVWS